MNTFPSYKAKSTLKALISPKHFDGLIVLSRILSIPAFMFFNNGNIWYRGRNTTYAVLREYGYTYDAKTQVWDIHHNVISEIDPLYL